MSGELISYEMRGPVFRKRRVIKGWTDTPEEVPFYLFCVFVDHTLIAGTEAIVAVVGAIMAMTLGGRGTGISET